MVSPQYQAHPDQGVGGREARLGEEQPGLKGVRYHRKLGDNQDFKDTHPHGEADKAVALLPLQSRSCGCGTENRFNRANAGELNPDKCRGHGCTRKEPGPLTGSINDGDTFGIGPHQTPTYCRWPFRSSPSLTTRSGRDEKGWCLRVVEQCSRERSRVGARTAGMPQ